ncbi:MAG: cellulase N-terminal Ig-like domain-containing protein, partial [Tepidisphaeraceae bacterium]
MRTRQLRIAAIVLSAVLSSVVTQTAAMAQAITGSPYPSHAVPRLAGETIKGLPAVTGRIHVDQFGYLPEAQKVAVISDPQKGYNAGDKYTPGNELEVRRKSNGQPAFKGSPTPWNNGAVHEDSGDRGWWFDFSSLKEPGEYYIYDTSTKLRSPVFKIARNVYQPVLRAAVRMFYFQREAVPIEKKY